MKKILIEILSTYQTSKYLKLGLQKQLRFQYNTVRAAPTLRQA